MKIGILTGGGDVQPLNSVIASAIDAANKNNIDLIGFIRGWQGVLENDFLSLKDKTINKDIGGTILKSSRVNLAQVQNGADLVKVNLDNLGIEGLIIIGGEDTLSNSFYLNEIPQVLISKTIDNDVGIISDEKIVNYFTLGHPTAAEKISSFVSINEGLRTTAYSHERIIIVESMGMHAGWLALSSSMGHPDFIILPEFPIQYENLIDLVHERFIDNHNVIIVIAEGAKWSNGEYIAADDSEADSFDHPRFKGSASILAEKLKNDLKKYFDTRNVNSVNPSYLYRSGKPNELDIFASIELGKKVIESFRDKIDSPILLTTNFTDNKLVIDKYTLSEVSSIDKLHRFVTERFYDPEKLQATEEGKIFLRKITPELPLLNYTL